MALHLATISWSCFVLLIFWQFSNASAVPDWCVYALRIKNFAISSPNGGSSFESHDDSVLLCQIDETKYDKQPETVSSLLLAVWDGEKSLIEFIAGDVIFKLMSGNDFRVLVTSSNRVLKGTFVNLADFEYFHSLVCQDGKYSPQNFAITGLEIYKHSVEDDEESCGHDLDVQARTFEKAVVFSQYSIDSSVMNDGESRFVIEDKVEGAGNNSYLMFEPFKFRSTRYQINSQVILTRCDDENTYYIIHLDTPNNALSFARYIGQFSAPEPNGLLIPIVLENFLNY